MRRRSSHILFARGRERPVLDDFVTDDVVRKVFRQWLDGVDEARLRDDGGAREALRCFVKNALSEIFKGNDFTTSLPLLNRDTVDTKIPLLAKSIEEIDVKTF